MAPLTWRNVDAPNFSGSASALQVSGQGFSNASRDLMASIEGFQEGRTQAASSQLMADILKNRSSAELSTALSNGILGSADPRYITPEALAFAADYQTSLLKNDLANRTLAARGAGGGRGGKGGRDDFVDVNNTGIRGYYDADGNITSSQVNGPESTVPAQTRVSELPSDIVSDVVAAADPSVTGMLPEFESEAGAPVTNITQVAPTLENAAALGSGSVPSVSTPAPVNDGTNPAVELMTSVRTPTPGPIRVGTPRGKDGFNQRNYELSVDAIQDRALAFSGDPSGAIESMVNNARYPLNGTTTNLLTLTDNTIKAAREGQVFREGQSEERKRNREETDELRGRGITEAARESVTPLIVGSATPDEAIARLDIEALGPEVYTRSVAEIREAEKNGAWADVTRPRTQTAPIPSAADIDFLAPAKEPEKQETKKEAEAKTEAVATGQEPASTTVAPVILDLKNNLSNVNARFAVDRSGNTTGTFDNNFLKAADDDSPTAAVVNRLIGKGGLLQGRSEDKVTDDINYYSKTYGVYPSVAALALADSVRSERVIGDFTPFTGESEEVQFDYSKVDRLLGSITDPATGNAANGESGTTIEQRMKRLRTSNEARTNANTLVQEAERLQLELERNQRLKATSRRNLDLTEATKKRDEAVSRAQQALDAVMRNGGAASTFRGNPAPPQRATDPVTVPAGTRAQIQEPVNGRSVLEVYRTLLDELGREPTNAEAQNMRERAEAIVRSRRVQSLLARSAGAN
ncbi:virion structural protein [Sinorhizobium phage ort11]|uniref:Uncharacterized protein n=1 Tax=Sinorhizobium phage ort11 TaxID=2599764 RepID=A0A5C2H2Z8_9CAUD|nr:virion structural protein [Sinorhizobium phage ort11]QEP29866.1 hypothetical protein Smphiort11_068 [Sinorhizobium phage ort11]